MYPYRSRRRKFRVAVSLLCVLGMLVVNLPHPIAQANAQGGNEPERSRSNHDTQIKVFGPLNVRFNTWNGNLFYSVPILTIPGRGLSIELSLGYNSSWHESISHYGYGWQLSYNMYYLREENGDITIVWGDGSSDLFVNDNGSYLSPVDTYDTLQEYEADKYVLRTKHGLEFYFDSPIHKGVTKMQEPNGNGLTFAYDADMLLTSVTDASGRQVNLAYIDGNLTSITDPNTTPGRSFQFQYDIDDSLISIVDALGNATDYGYDAEHYLTSIAPPCGIPTAITYSDGAVTNVTGGLISRSFSYDTANRITTMTDSAPEGDQTTSFFYDALFILQCEIGIANVLCPASGPSLDSTPGRVISPADPAEKPREPEPVILDVGSGEVAAGTDIEVPVTMLASEEMIGAATIEIQYDPSILHVIDCAANPNKAFDSALCNTDSERGMVRLSAISAGGASGLQALANITFQAIGQTGESSAVTLEVTAFARASGLPVKVSVRAGQITIVDVVLPDPKHLDSRSRSVRHIL